ncbi:hypothetical protein KKR91_11150 [Arthrobacter jiangjiafuii]|uniref:LPXTG-motif cell wall anchor domain-containing protein n=1 Tax=Arthrobacter jiangjiafuii TaxID=2817475 RepID=A0A975M341_9MICC|nr:hypothetical protein [Arthrobacter jiangjiafuii]MBP3043557.1 hypothetical protein [Arthrobacter jiangjiafuii]QWC09070.1 hypothetical protein KKR91_11150 [Arthrobacter jiangjiafuii]
MKNVLKITATAGATALAIGGLSLAAMTPAVATGTASPAPSVSVKEQVGAYVYKMLRPDEQAAWGNSGKQRLIVVVDGSEWVPDETIMAKLPAEVCGTGWAIQQDKLEVTGAFSWPETITYPEEFKDGGDLQGSTHKKLEEHGEIPDCVTTPAPETPAPSTPATSPPLVTVPSASPSPTVGPSPKAASAPSTTPISSTTPSPSPTLGTTVTGTPSGTTGPSAAPMVDATAELARTGANAPVMTAVVGAGALAIGLGTTVLVRSRRRQASPDA